MSKYWWQSTNIYQIYPRSFQDGNGDGMGDLKGIITRLDYLKDLGVEVIWLSPINKSPMCDNGYDISDYYTIDPIFGTNEDMDELLAEAKKRDIKIIMDLVVNHCSIEHEWFQKAKADPEGEYGQYFYIRKSVDGKAPNNWRSIFRGPAWDKIEGTDYYYLHLFDPGQPDLNWENPKLRAEIYDMINYWLDKGVAGFRLDAITYIKKEEGLPSYPADSEDGMVSVSHGSLCRPGIDEFLHEMKEKTYGNECLTAGETAGVPDERLFDFIGIEDGHFSMIFDFDPLILDTHYEGSNGFFCQAREWEVEELKEKLFHTQMQIQPEGWIVNVLENHDSPRIIDHLLKEDGQNFYGASMLAVMSMCRRGTPVIYQGQEFGMRNFPFESIDMYDDVSSKGEYDIALEHGFSEEEALKCVQRRSRDNARYPVSWEASENAGFTTGKPWLPVAPEHTTVNAAAALADPDSLYYVYKKLLAMRKDDEIGEVMVFGKFNPYKPEQKDLVAYTRFMDEEFEAGSLLILCNYQGQAQTVEIPTAEYDVVYDNYKDKAVTGKSVELNPYEAVIIKVK